jgi:hypothetical protein
VMRLRMLTVDCMHTHAQHACRHVQFKRSTLMACWAAAASCGCAMRLVIRCCCFLALAATGWPGPPAVPSAYSGHLPQARPGGQQDRPPGGVPCLQSLPAVCACPPDATGAAASTAAATPTQGRCRCAERHARIWCDE